MNAHVIDAPIAIAMERLSKAAVRKRKAEIRSKRPDLSRWEIRAAFQDLNAACAEHEAALLAYVEATGDRL